VSSGQPPTTALTIGLHTSFAVVAGVAVVALVLALFLNNPKPVVGPPESVAGLDSARDLDVEHRAAERHEQPQP
jgi:hypothetical protein